MTKLLIPSWHKLQTRTLISMTIGFFCISGVLAQTNVTGMVTDSNGLPMPGVTIIEKGTSNGVITGMEGNYSIGGLGEESVLVFRYVGFVLQEIVVGDQRQINVQLEIDSQALDEVVVVGYGTQERREVTGAVASMDGENIRRLSTSNFQESMQGQMAGVNVSSTSGAPGSMPTVTIRGMGSILSTGEANSPLYVVDGIPYQGTPDISPNEIESIDVLKDAASASIYGTRGSNGVILITTKQGRVGELQVEFTSYYAVQNLSESMPLMNTQEQIYNNRLAALNGGGTYVYDYTLDKHNVNVLNNTDWIGEFTRDWAPLQNYNLSLSGGREDLNFNLNANHFRQVGSIINSNFNRTSVRATTTFKKNKFHTTASLNLQQRQSEDVTRNLFDMALRMDPFRGVEDFGADELIGEEGGVRDMDELARAVKNTRNMEVNSLFAAIKMQYEIAPGLSIGANIGGNFDYNSREIFKPTFIFTDPVTGEATTNSNRIAEYERRVQDRFRYTAEFSTNYNRQIGDHEFSILALYSMEQFKQSVVDGSASGFLSNESMVFSNATGTPLLLGDKEDLRITGMLGRVQYDFKNKYLLSASIRRDGSSVFPEENRYGIFPSVSVGYNLHEENFFRDLVSENFLRSFKIRYGYGQTGNSRISSYVYIPTVRANVDYVLGPGDQHLENGVITTDIFNEQDLKWETSIQHNLGFDMEFFRGKFGLTVDLYERQSMDLLFPLDIPGSVGTSFSGNSSIIKNIGDIQNKGIEIGSFFRTQLGQDWDIRLSGTFTKNKNEVLKMGAEDQIIYGGRYTSSDDPVTVIREGYPIGSFFVIPSNGVINTREELLLARTYNSSAQYGDLMYQDSNGDGTLDDNDRVFYDDGSPDWEAGLNINIGYKNFDFMTVLYGVQGTMIFNGAKFQAYGYARHKDYVNMWSPQNPNSEVFAVRRGGSASLNERSWSDYWLEDGDYLRIRNITLGYTLPKNIQNRLGFMDLRVYVSSINPFTFTEYTGYNPDVGGGILNRGVDDIRYPMADEYRFGVQMKF